MSFVIQTILILFLARYFFRIITHFMGLSHQEDSLETSQE